MVLEFDLIPDIHEFDWIESRKMDSFLTLLRQPNSSRVVLFPGRDLSAISCHCDMGATNPGRTMIINKLAADWRERTNRSGVVRL